MQFCDGVLMNTCKNADLCYLLGYVQPIYIAKGEKTKEAGLC